MQAQKIFFRITKFLGKAILWLLLTLVFLVAVIHLPFVQQHVTHALSDHLSSRIGSRVDIERIDFSIRANLVLRNLDVWDRDQSRIFSIREAEVSSSIFGLIKGDYIIDDVRITGFEGRLIEDQQGLNIQFILDAFISDQDQTATPNAISIQFKKVQLEDIIFEYTSIPDGVTVGGHLGKFITTDAEFSTNPTRIKAEKVVLQRTEINTVIDGHPGADNATFISDDNKTIRPDFGTGIIFEIGDLEFDDNDFSFHRGNVADTRKFDGSHITLKDIQIRLSDILMREDTLAGSLNSLSVKLPGITLTDAKADLKLNGDHLSLSGIRLASDSNVFTANIKAWYDSNSIKDSDHVNVRLTAAGTIYPAVATYFFSDSVMAFFRDWETIGLALDGAYSAGKGEIKTLTLRTGNSFLQAGGMVFDIFDPEKLHWKDFVVNASMGPDFQKILTPFVRDIKLPPVLRMQLTSSGNPENIYLNGKLFTAWGDVRTIGKLAQQTNRVEVDVNLTGEKVDLRKWMGVSWLGPVDLDVDAKGIIGDEQHVEINGFITEMTMLDQSVSDITFEGTTRENNATIDILIEDPEYHAKINSEISFAGPLTLSNIIQLNEFKLGRLLRRDSTMSISGDTRSKIVINQSSLEGYVEGTDIFLQNQSRKYPVDTLNFHTLISPAASEVEYYTNNAKANLRSNFDLRQFSEVIQIWSENYLKARQNNFVPTGDKTLKFNFEMANENLFQLMGVTLDEFSSLEIAGEMDEQKKSIALRATSGKLKGYGVSLDTMNANLTAFGTSVNANSDVKNLVYNSIQLGNLDFDVLSKGDTAISNLTLSNDSAVVVGVSARILTDDGGAFVYPDKFLAFDRTYLMDAKNPVHLSNKNVVFNQFKIARDDMSIALDGDLSAFDISVRNVDVTLLNFLLSPDSALIDKGHLNGDVSYIRDQQLNLKAVIDSLSIYQSSPLTISATAKSDGSHIPFEFLLTNESNTIDLKGQYASDNTEVDASLLLDVRNLELFSFLVSDFVDEMKGSLKGEVIIDGLITKPEFKGFLQFGEAELTTLNPQLTFKVRDDRILLDRSSVMFDNFMLYDEQDQPLKVNGNISTDDYESFSYDLQMNTDNYTVINKPDSASGRFYGKLVVGSDIKLKGNSKDTRVEAKLIIKNATDMTFINSSDEIGLLKAEGVIDFVDPLLLLDSAAIGSSVNYYDSLVASLPDFNLNSTIAVEDDAMVRIVIDPQSGDYIEVSGGATLDLEYDRTGNLHLSGNYTIKNGVYRLSFYDLVKKNFTLVQGSSINWSGSPENGDLNIKAVHTVESNSLGLIGHEIGENEKSIYKRSLDYEVGININGTIESPLISFSLDLPKEEKTNYPVLANKLDRLRQPEYESELNKQVFGLLVLGGFLPETSGSDINSNLIATTALSNSVNSLLASQLNRFASQYIKGVNIDVGIQSFSDYSAPGGKTQTAMDFRVSKSVMNDRLSFEVGGDFDINQDQSGANTGSKNYRGDIAIIYDLTGNGDKQLKLFNNETYDIIYQEIRNTGISIIFIREFAGTEKNKKK